MKQLLNEQQAAIIAAAEKLVRCKGRYHSEQNYRALAALFGVTVPDLPPLAAEAQEPVAEIRAYYPLGIDGGKQKFIQPCGELPDFGAKLYAAPQPAPVAQPIGITDKSEIECLKRGEMANVMPPDYKGVDAGDEVYLYATPVAQPVQLPVVNLPPEFYSSEGVMVQLEKLMAALAVCGINYERKGNDCRAAMLQPSSGALQLREGYVLVPVDPTIAILDEFDSIIDYGTEDSKDAWSRLLAAAWVKSLPAAPQEPTKCWCHTCRPVTMTDMRFVVCPECGNKRCPKGNDHRNTCTGSNEPGQEGSAYPELPQERNDG